MRFRDHADREAAQPLSGALAPLLRMDRGNSVSTMADDGDGPETGKKPVQNRSDARRAHSIRFSGSEWSPIERAAGTEFRPASSAARAPSRWPTRSSRNASRSDSALLPAASEAIGLHGVSASRAPRARCLTESPPKREDEWTYHKETADQAHPWSLLLFL